MLSRLNKKAFIFCTKAKLTMRFSPKYKLLYYSNKFETKHTIKTLYQTHQAFTKRSALPALKTLFTLFNPLK
jgi:hypothetical protein